MSGAQKKHLDSRGNHVYFNYSGAFKKGKMHGIGTFCFAEQGAIQYARASIAQACHGGVNDRWICKFIACACP